MFTFDVNQLGRGLVWDPDAASKDNLSCHFKKVNDGIRSWLKQHREEVDEELKPKAKGGGEGGLSKDVFLNELRVLKEKLSDLERSNGERFEHHDGTFGSPAEVQRAVQSQEIPSCGMYWDLFSALVAMLERAKTGKEYSDEKYSVERARLKQNESNLMAAMTHQRPAALFRKNGKVDLLSSASEGMEACKSFSKWIGDGTSSYCNSLTTCLEGYLSGLRGTFTAADGGSRLARSLLDDVAKQWNALTSFIQKFYTKMVKVAKFSEINVWRLIKRCLVAIFDTMKPHHYSTPHNKAAVMWARFKISEGLREGYSAHNR
jgi:hypothetical protein